jgi:ubiquinone/menaquinone biosynthesis C-methylase UbiE
MSKPNNAIAEQAAANAFSRQSAVFDTLYDSDPIVAYKRERVRAVLSAWLQPGMRVLELNSGTGTDAIWLAKQGCMVHATDLAEGMLDRLRQKVAEQGLEEQISTERCSFTQLTALTVKKEFDLVFSNFAGLNCTGELDKVLDGIDAVLAPGGVAVLVVMPGFCLWESLLLLRGKWKTATRRWWSKRGAPAKVEGMRFTCWYYAPSFITKHIGQRFRHLRTEGLCTIVPPSYLEHFSVRYPGWYARLVKWENRFCRSWPWRNWGDYYIIALQKNAAHKEASKVS